MPERNNIVRGGLKTAYCFFAENRIGIFSVRNPSGYSIGFYPFNAPTGRFETFLEELSPLYDMIIIDTAPILLVTDTITIAKYCDLLVYLAKAGHTDKNLLQVPVDLVKDQKVANIGIILNAVGENESYGYGYNYGYGYGYKEQQKKKKWYHFKSNS